MQANQIASIFIIPKVSEKREFLFAPIQTLPSVEESEENF
jgi:hypothetical protein